MTQTPSWKPSYSCKLPGVDKQHKELIQFFVDYLENHEEGKRGQEKESLTFLRSYIMKHFSAEEKMMNTYNYPGVEDHKIAHREYISEYKRIITEFKETKNLLQLQFSLKGMLDWFLAHIQEYDTPMGAGIIAVIGEKMAKISAEEPEQLAFKNESYNKLKRLNQAGVLNTYEQHIDDQHIELIDKFSDFIELSEKDKATPKSLEMLKFLNSYIKNHFQEEQNLMARYSYPLARLHQKAHGQYQSNFNSIIANFSKGKSLETLTEDIKGMLDWFLEHIQEHDIRMSFYCKNKAMTMHSKKRPLIVSDSPKHSKDQVEFFETFGLSKIIETGDVNKAFDIMSKQQISLLICTSTQEYYSIQPLLKRLKERNFEIPLALLSAEANHANWTKTLELYDRPKLGAIFPQPLDINHLVRQLDQWLFQFNQGPVELELQIQD